MSALTKGDMEFARALAKETVAETFLMLGVNVSNPEGVQSAQSQFAFLRNAYHATRQIRNVAITAIFGLIASGVCWAVWASIKTPAAATAVISHAAQ